MIFLFLLVIALIPASIAQKKGRSFILWYIFGVCLWFVAVVAALVVSDKNNRCKECLSVIDERAKTCPNCRTKVEETK